MATAREPREADLILGAFPRRQQAVESEQASNSLAEVIDLIPFLLARLASHPTDLA